jgi:glyoxylase I family protein
MSIGVESFNHVTVNITDLAKAKAFYTGVLGLEEIERPASFDFPGAWYRIGAVLIHLVGRAQRDPETTQHYCLWVTDVRAAAKKIEAGGCEVKWDKRKIEGVDRFFTRDPDGNRIEIQGWDGKTFAA